MVKTSGLDMKESIAWHESNKSVLLQMMPKPVIGIIPYEIRGAEYLEFGLPTLRALLDLFSVQAHERAVTRAIIGKSSRWFKSEQLGKTDNPLEALSPTSFIPSRCDNADWKNPNIPVSDIILYQIPTGLCSASVSSMISGQGLVHELAHNIVHPARTVDDYMLEIDGEYGPTISGENVFRQFCELADKHTPMSVYSESYDRAEDYKLAMDEEFAESVAAFVLGFIYTGDDKRNFNPFIDRPEMKMFIRNFLMARMVSTCHQAF